MREETEAEITNEIAHRVSNCEDWTVGVSSSPTQSAHAMHGSWRCWQAATKESAVRIRDGCIREGMKKDSQEQPGMNPVYVYIF